MSARILAGVLHGVISVYLLGDQIIAGVGFDSFSNEKSCKFFNELYLILFVKIRITDRGISWMPHSLLLTILFSLIFRYFHLRRYLCLYHSS